MAPSQNSNSGDGLISVCMSFIVRASRWRSGHPRFLAERKGGWIKESERREKNIEKKEGMKEDGRSAMRETQVTTQKIEGKVEHQRKMKEPNTTAIESKHCGPFLPFWQKVCLSPKKATNTFFFGALGFRTLFDIFPSFYRFTGYFFPVLIHTHTHTHPLSLWISLSLVSLDHPLKILRPVVYSIGQHSLFALFSLKYTKG